MPLSLRFTVHGSPFTGSSFDQPLAPRGELLRTAPELAQAWFGEMVPARGDRRHATALVAALEGDPSASQTGWERDAQAAETTTIAHPSLDHASAGGLALRATVDGTTLAPGRDDIPGIPESGEIVEEGPVGRHERWGSGRVCMVSR